MSIFGNHYYGDEREDFDQGYRDQEYHHRDWDRDRHSDQDEAYFEGQRAAERDEERRQEERREEEAEERRAHERYVEAQREEEEYLYQQQQEAEYFAQQEQQVEEQAPPPEVKNENF
jgi:hypothetical protein